MAMGCAVIASEVGAIPEILNISGDEPCGICIKPRNTRELNNALSYLMSDYEKINSLGNNGTTRVLTNYTMSIIGKEYEKAWHMAVYNRYDIKPTSRV
jgi:glycosyltransferase involved in cell wall biosynthesis